MKDLSPSVSFMGALDIVRKLVLILYENLRGMRPHPPPPHLLSRQPMIPPRRTPMALGLLSPRGKPSPEIFHLDQSVKPIAQLIDKIPYRPMTTQPINHLMLVTPHTSLRKAKGKAPPLLYLIQQPLTQLTSKGLDFDSVENLATSSVTPT